MSSPPTAPIPSRLDAIETILADLLPRLTIPHSSRGRPDILTGALLWAAVLVCILRGTPHQRAVWRLVSGAGLWQFPAVAISAEAVRKRLIGAGPNPMAHLYQLATDELVAMVPDDTTLAPFATGVYALDASTLDQVARTLPALRGVPAGDVALLPGRLHSVFDLRRQLFRTVLPVELPRQNEQRVAPDLVATLPPGSLILADRGYFSFRWVDTLTDDGYWYISRMRTSLTTIPVHVLSDHDQVRDELAWLGAYRADRAKHLVRVVTIRVGPGVQRYLTNVCDPQLLPPAEILRLYARRWDIELAFKLVKRDLGLYLLWSASWEQILTQIWGTLLIAQIAFAVRAELAQRADVDLFDISLTLLLRDLPRYAQRQEPDVLAAIVARGPYGGILRPSRRRRDTLPRELPITPPPPGLVRVRVPRYAGRPGPRTRRALLTSN